MGFSSSTITAESDLASALKEARSALSANDHSLHAVGPLFIDEGRSVSPLFKAAVELAADYQDCPLELHLILNGCGQARQGITAIQELGDAIGDARMRTAHPCRIVIASVSGADYLVHSGDDWANVKRLYEAIVDGKPMAVTSVVATIESYYAQGLRDTAIVPTCFFGRGIRNGDGLLFLGERENDSDPLPEAILDREFCGFSRGKVPELAWTA